MLDKVRKEKPVVLNITNVVTMDLLANAQLAIGAAPIMTQSLDELVELLRIASSVVINIGTLDESFIALARQAVKTSKPVVLDPVGVGATTLRTDIAREFLCDVDIIRGNGSEIYALTETCQTRGVESSFGAEKALGPASRLGKVAVITGATDYVIQADRRISLSGGSPLMERVTGMGCALSGVIAAFAAVHTDLFEAAYEATKIYGECGYKASLVTSYPGSFRTSFLDHLYAA